MIDKADIVAVVLAGGRATRMQEAEKPLQLLGETPLIGHVIRRIEPAVSTLVISANRRLQDYARFGYPCVEDLPCPHASPLIGIYSALRWYDAQGSAATHLLCVPADVPVFPQDIVATLAAGMATRPTHPVYASTGGQIQPLFSLWPRGCVGDLERCIGLGQVGVHRVLSLLEATRLELALANPLDFGNINTLDQLTTLESQLKP